MKYICCLFALSALALAKPTQPFQLGALLDEIETNQGIPPKPMDTTGLDSKLQSVLNLYFQKSLGGEANWKKVDTLLLKGEIRFSDGETLAFKNYRKKPDLNKTILYLPEDFEMIQSFDGLEAWEWLTYESPEPRLMSPELALDFTRDACFGSHLIYPLLANKKLEYLGPQIVDEKPQMLVKVSLPNDQHVQIGLNASGFQVSEETINSIDGKKRRTLQSDFKTISGVVIPFKTKTFFDEEWIHEVRIDSAVFNKGVYSWMFKN